MEGDAKLQEAGCIHFFKRSFKGSSHDDAPAPKVGAQKYQQDERLMEPDIDVEVKNLAIQLTALTKFNLMEEAVKTFKENKELEKAEAIRLKTETRVSLRAVGVVICIKCGHSWKGRIKKIWGVHPLRVYSKDVFSCTNYCVNDLESLEEHCLPHGVQKPASVMVLGGQGTYLHYL